MALRSLLNTSNWHRCRRRALTSHASPDFVSTVLLVGSNHPDTILSAVISELRRRGLIDVPLYTLFALLALLIFCFD